MNDIDERIIQYYDGGMSEEEMQQFLHLIENDPILKSEWEFYGRLIEGIQSEGAIELKEYIKEHVGQSDIQAQSNLWMYAAASITFLLFSYFAIYSYLETGNIKEATEIITLKDKKSDKFKFWKRNKSIPPSGENGNLDESNEYQDSLALLEEQRNKDTTLALLDVPEVLPENDDLEEEAVTESVSEQVNTGPIMEAKQKRALPMMQIAQLKLVPIRLAYSLPEDISSGMSANAPSVRASATTKKFEKSSVTKEEITKKPIADSASQYIKVRPKEIKSAAAVELNYFEQEKADIKIVVKRSKQSIELDLINIWGENPLVYDIQGELYLDIGQLNSLSGKGKTKSGIWRIPETSGTFEELEWITDPQIIGKIRN